MNEAELLVLIKDQMHRFHWNAPRREYNRDEVRQRDDLLVAMITRIEEYRQSIYLAHIGCEELIEQD